MEDFKFSALEYKRPDFEGIAAFAVQAKERIEAAASYEEVKKVLTEMEERSKD